MGLRFPTTGASLSWGDILGDAPTALTWMAWLRRGGSNLANDVRLFEKSTSAFLYPPSTSTPNGLAVGVFGVSERRGTETGVLVANTYVHVAVTYTSTGPVATIYANGVSLTMTGTNPTYPDQAAAALQWLHNTGVAYDIAHFRWWSATLTASEVAQEQFAYKPQRSQNLEIWCPFDDGLTPKDYSGNLRHPVNTNCTVTDEPPVSYGAAVLVL